MVWIVNGDSVPGFVSWLEDELVEVGTYCKGFHFVKEEQGGTGNHVLDWQPVQFQ